MTGVHRMLSLDLDAAAAGRGRGRTKSASASLSNSPRHSTRSESTTEDELMNIKPLMEADRTTGSSLTSVDEEDELAVDGGNKTNNDCQTAGHHHHRHFHSKRILFPNKNTQLSKSYSEGMNVSGGVVRHRFNAAVVDRWKRLARKSRESGDPWHEFHIADLAAEQCVRYRYTSLWQSWTEDVVFVKMATEPFTRGAMRECYRLKKLSKFSPKQNWDHAHNYVAKRFIADVDRQTVFDDVKLQLDAKLWAEEYNRHNPPKKIDIIQVYVLEFVNRENKPLFHLEHYIEGDYIKYNSNSGFVNDVCRLTPQAFSHFTFERSGHQLIIVDVQGVGDLYTDPQIHTADDTGYGDGNLGTKGMALFFHSHGCNDICDSMGLTAFDLSPSERACQADFIQSNRHRSDSLVRGDEELCVSLPASYGERSAMESLRVRTISLSSGGDNDSLASPRRLTEEEEAAEPSSARRPQQHDELCVCRRCMASCHSSQEDNGSVFAALLLERDEEPRRTRQRSKTTGALGESDDGDVTLKQPLSSTGSEQTAGTVCWPADLDPPAMLSAKGCCYLSECDSFNSGSLTNVGEAEVEAYWLEARKRTRPAGYVGEIERQALATLQDEPGAKAGSTGSILGQIHLDLARYHELGRFVREEQETKQYDRAAAWFHLDIAATCGCLEAIVTVARIYLDLPHDLLKDVTMERDDEHVDQGLDMMQQAANMGDKSAMLFMAEAYETGEPLGSSRKRSWLKAVQLYQRGIQRNEKEDEEPDEDFDAVSDQPKHQILAKMAEMYRSGGWGLSKDANKAGDVYTEAAESAMEALKGKLANQFYMKAEECYGEAEDE